jgi:putative hydrolase of the HAD superfamily
LTQEEAFDVRRDYFSRYGTTLGGLVAEQDVDIHNYLDFVHDIPVESYLGPNPTLAAMLAALPLRKVVYTNATAEYSRRVLRALDVADQFERVIGIEKVGLRNKRYRDAYERVLALLDASGPECIMVEDTAHNLWPAKAVGMTTVLVSKDGSTGPPLFAPDRRPRDAARGTGGPVAGDQPVVRDERVDFVVESVLDVGQVVQRLQRQKPGF